MESKYKGVHIPTGCTVLVGETEGSLVDIGVIPDDQESNVELTYDKKTVQGSKLEKVISYVTNMKAKGSTSIYQIRLDVINALCGGVMKVTQVAGAAVSGEAYSIASGWELNRAYVLPGQNSTGLAQTIASVKSGSKTLAAGTDYVAVKTGEGWGIQMISSANASSGTALTVTYGYTPAAYVKATMGGNTVEIKENIVRFLKVQDGKKFQCTLWAAAVSGGLKLSFPSSTADKPASLPLEIEGALDSSRAEGDQLIEVIDEIGVA